MAQNQLLILEGNQLFLSKSGVLLFGWKTVVYIKIRCLESAEDWKSAIQMKTVIYITSYMLTTHTDHNNRQTL